jgi:hypothetical protein
MLERTSTSMERIHSAVVVVNTWQVTEDGILESFVIGVDGAWTLTTSLLSDISWVGTTNQLDDERSSWILRYNWERNVPIVEELVIMLEGNRLSRIW